MDFVWDCVAFMLDQPALMCMSSSNIQQVKSVIICISGQGRDPFQLLVWWVNIVIFSIWKEKITHLQSS